MKKLRVSLIVLLTGVLVYAVYKTKTFFSDGTHTDFVAVYTTFENIQPETFKNNIEKRLSEIELTEPLDNKDALLSLATDMIVFHSQADAEKYCTYLEDRARDYPPTTPVAKMRDSLIRRASSVKKWTRIDFDNITISINPKKLRRTYMVRQSAKAHILPGDLLKKPIVFVNVPVAFEDNLMGGTRILFTYSYRQNAEGQWFLTAWSMEGPEKDISRVGTPFF